MHLYKSIDFKIKKNYWTQTFEHYSMPQSWRKKEVSNVNFQNEASYVYIYGLFC